MGAGCLLDQNVYIFMTEIFDPSLPPGKIISKPQHNDRYSVLNMFVMSVGIYSLIIANIGSFIIAFVGTGCRRSHITNKAIRPNEIISKPPNNDGSSLLNMFEMLVGTYNLHYN